MKSPLQRRDESAVASEGARLRRRPLQNLGTGTSRPGRETRDEYKEKRDFSLRRPTGSQERSGMEKIGLLRSE